MITITIGNELLMPQVQAVIAFVTEGNKQEPLLQKFTNTYIPQLENFLHDAAFTGKAGSLFSLPFQYDGNIATLLLVGLGAETKAGVIGIEQYRRAVGKAIKTLQARKLTQTTLLVPSASLFGLTADEVIQETALIASMAEFHFDEFITNPERKVCTDSALALVGVPPLPSSETAVECGLIIAAGVNQARHWVDMPPSRLTPVDLVGKAKHIALQHNLVFKSFSELEINQMGMGGLSGVAAGSEQDCALVILEYRSDKAGAPTIALVGKGITFDSGGLSLKPADFMETMKDDMAGAAAVINTMQILAQLKPDVNVIGVTPLSENLPSGAATKPGDILRFYNGKTAEVRNTDAEGRLILADALAYAVQHYCPDAMIDIATLTGACSYALGPFFSGLMTQDENLSKKIVAAGNRTGDRVWPLPLDDDYKKAVQSHIADICNIGTKKYKAGAITAAFFLKEFVGDVAWAHLDIAGTAFEVPDISYFSHGATGAGVRLFVDLMMHWDAV